MKTILARSIRRFRKLEPSRFLLLLSLVLPIGCSEQSSASVTRPRGTATSALAAGCAEDQYTCDDGTCIDSSLVCDGKPDCPSGEDEDRCNRSCGDMAELVCTGCSDRLVSRLAGTKLDVYTVEVEAGQVIEIRVFGADRWESIVKVTDSADNVLAFNSGGRAFDAALSLAAPVSDVYKIWITGAPDYRFQGTMSAGCYTASITLDGQPLTTNPRGCSDAGLPRPLCFTWQVPPDPDPKSCRIACEGPLPDQVICTECCNPP